MTFSVSVVIPVYNGADHIAQAIASVWSQSLAAQEVIVVDDGSNDGTKEVVQALSKRGPLCYIYQPNRGRSAARNRGIAASHSDWIAFLDADDYWLPNKLRAQFLALEASGSEFTYSAALVYDDAGNFVQTRLAAPCPSLLANLMWSTQLTTSTVIVNKSLLARTGVFNETLLLGEDWDLFLRLAMDGTPIAVPTALVEKHGVWDGKGYDLRDYEAAVLEILSTFFARIKNQERFRFLLRQRHQVWSWHYAVLSKSFFRHQNYSRALFYAAQSLRSHRAGLRYLLPKSNPDTTDEPLPATV